jgi:hypothetical protein
VSAGRRWRPAPDRRICIEKGYQDGDDLILHAASMTLQDRGQFVGEEAAIAAIAASLGGSITLAAWAAIKLHLEETL